MSNYNSLFLSQSYKDNWADYEKSLTKQHFAKWDYVILTASNEDQAETYREQIAYRLEANLLPKQAHYAVLPDPDGKRVGSGGATLNVLRYVAEHMGTTERHFEGKRILVIHSGGDSKRVPQYSACGKLFSPVPRALPDGRRSTLFDEFIIAMSGVPSRFRDGMLVLSGDVLLLFNPLQIDYSGKGAAAISIKEAVETGKNHGVFLADEDGNVGNFLHKQTVESLTNIGAVNAQGNVDLDTGAVLLSTELLQELYGLIEGSAERFDRYVSEVTRLSFYGDFLYPLATNSTLEQYYKETPEGDFSEELTECRTELWEVLHKYRMKLIALSPAEFIHFGTTRELLHLMTEDVRDYGYLDWKGQVQTNVPEDVPYAANNSYVEEQAQVGAGTYLEDSYINGGTIVGKECVISGITLEGVTVPDGTVLHCVKQRSGGFVVRIYGIDDNPKDVLEKNGRFLGDSMETFLRKNGLRPEDLWSDDNHALWFANLYAEFDTIAESLEHALNVYAMSRGEGDVTMFRSVQRTNLCRSFNEADNKELLPWQWNLKDRVNAFAILRYISDGYSLAEVSEKISRDQVNGKVVLLLRKEAAKTSFSTKIRIYYYLSRLAGKQYAEEMENLCFQTIGDMIYESSLPQLPKRKNSEFVKEKVTVQLPVRVNFGGGWSDTPPFCNEHGGAVLNAALRLDGRLPIEVSVRKLERPVIVLASTDSGAEAEFTDLNQIRDCHNPYDAFALHKAALLACGIVPLEDDGTTIEGLALQLGGGLYLSTGVVNIPRGSGLGTSSILAGACVKGLLEIFGGEPTEEELFARVLVMEQMMSTGGGWQDQVGGLVPGFKMITTAPGLWQKIQCQSIALSEETVAEFQERFVLIYTGQRRLARNLLREVVGNYIAGRKESIEVLEEIQRVAALMAFELQKGKVDRFAKLLSEHWELSKKLDAGCTNTCIDQIFLASEDLLEGRMICGAGGGGFLQAILKKGHTKQELRERLLSVFQNSGVDVWECSFEI